MNECVICPWIFPAVVVIAVTLIILMIWRARKDRIARITLSKNWHPDDPEERARRNGL